MDDEIKKAGLLKLICADCLEHKTYHYRDIPSGSEFYYCPHTKNLVTWRDHMEPHGLVFPDVSDEEFFITISQARALADQAQARMN